MHNLLYRQYKFPLRKRKKMLLKTNEQLNYCTSTRAAYRGIVARRDTGKFPGWPLTSDFVKAKKYCMLINILVKEHNRRRHSVRVPGQRTKPDSQKPEILGKHPFLVGERPLTKFYGPPSHCLGYPHCRRSRAK